jgi:hypothetical protein
VDRDADRPRLVGDRAGDRLADPPRRVGRELVAAAVLELVDAFIRPMLPFLNQVAELQPAVRILFAIEDDQPEVGLDQLLLRLLRPVLAAQNRVERLLQLVGDCSRRRSSLELELQLLDLAEFFVLFLQLLLLVLD